MGAPTRWGLPSVIGTTRTWQPGTQLIGEIATSSSSSTGIRHVELPLAGGRAVIGLNCERQTWTLFTLERKGREVYSFRKDPSWQYLPAGPIASSRLCQQPVRVAE